MVWDGQLLDSSIEEWAAGAPVNFNTQLTNTALQQLQRSDRVDHPNRMAHLAYDAGSSYRGEHVFDGQSSLRATCAAGAAVDNFRLWGPGAALIVGLTGAATNEIPIEPFRPMTFRFAARVTDGNLLRVRVVFRNAANAIAGYVTAAREIQAAAAFVALGTQPAWTYYSVEFVPPQQIGANVIDHMVWQISNGVAGAQLIDLDQITLKPTDQYEDL